MLNLNPNAYAKYKHRIENLLGETKCLAKYANLHYR